MLAKAIESESLIEDFSLCQSHKTEFNYHASSLTLDHARDVLDAARRLAAQAVQGMIAKDWFPSDFDLDDFTF